MRRQGIIGRAALALALLAAGVALAPAPAAAQTVGELPYLDAVDAWADGQELRRALPDGATKPSKPSKRARRPTVRQLAALRFEATAAVTQRNYQAVMDLLEPGYDPAAVVAEFDRVLGGFGDSMRAADVPLRPDDIADISAWTLLSAFAAYHDRNSFGDRGVRALRDAARRTSRSTGASAGSRTPTSSSSPRCSSCARSSGSATSSGAARKATPRASRLPWTS